MINIDKTPKIRFIHDGYNSDGSTKPRLPVLVKTTFNGYALIDILATGETCTVPVRDLMKNS